MYYWYTWLYCVRVIFNITYNCVRVYLLCDVRILRLTYSYLEFVSVYYFIYFCFSLCLFQATIMFCTPLQSYECDSSRFMYDVHVFLSYNFFSFFFFTHVYVCVRSYNVVPAFVYRCLTYITIFCFFVLINFLSVAKVMGFDNIT